MQASSLRSLGLCWADNAAEFVSDSLFEECMCVPGLCVRVVRVLQLLVQAQQAQAGTLLLLCGAVQPLLSFSQCQGRPQLLHHPLLQAATEQYAAQWHCRTNKRPSLSPMHSGAYSLSVAVPSPDCVQSTGYFQQSVRFGADVCASNKPAHQLVQQQAPERTGHT